MSKPAGFDNQAYLREQTAAILERVEAMGDKLYLEFGGKLLYDYHAARVLPGFDPNVKMRLLQNLKEKADIILCIYSGDIERRKVRADFGITYDTDALKLIDDLKDWGIHITAVVITRYDDQPAARVFKNKLEHRGIRVCVHRYTKGYPTDVDMIVSEEGYGANEYIETTNPLVVITGPGPGSGKLATCLSQLYHEHKRGIKVGYAKFETFPVWNLPLKHPVNVAYEAATADISDCNQIDPFHLEAYGKTSVNYNRDVEVFPVLRRILERISGRQSVYRSPTDMGVNKVGFAITDDALVREASAQEIIRRFLRYRCERVMGFVDDDTVQRVELLMRELDISPEERRVIAAADAEARRERECLAGSDGTVVAAALELADGTFITGHNSPLLHAASSLIINAIKHLAGIPKQLHLLPKNITESVTVFKTGILNMKSASLDLEETLIALSISAMSNPAAQLALDRLPEVRGCEMHSTHIPTRGDEEGLRRLGVNVTSDAVFSSKNLFIQ
ncbi:MAG: DUF1846 domain-containing protein [Deltaproteobacteria bacterium]|nr:DUF1846 domain-containing protein [Deltaproteobacteria bacterium]